MTGQSSYKKTPKTSLAVCYHKELSLLLALAKLWLVACESDFFGQHRRLTTVASNGGVWNNVG